MILIISVIVTGVIGYFVGILTSHYKEKMDAFLSALPILAKLIYDASTTEDADNYNKSVNKLLLISNKQTIKKLNELISNIHHPEKQTKNNKSITNLFQELIVEMRSEIQLFPHQKMEAKDFTQIYTKFKFFYDTKK